MSDSGDDTRPMADAGKLEGGGLPTTTEKYESPRSVHGVKVCDGKHRFRLPVF